MTIFLRTRKNALGFLAFAVAACLIPTLIGPAPSAARGWDRIAWTEPKIPGATIACFHQEQHRSTAERHPERCAIAGYKGEGRKVVVVPITGMKWGHWGAGTSRAAFGVDARTGTRVRVIVWRRIRCSDGRTEYSAASVLDLRNGHYFIIRLRLCPG